MAYPYLKLLAPASYTGDKTVIAGRLVPVQIRLSTFHVSANGTDWGDWLRDTLEGLVKHLREENEALKQAVAEMVLENQRLKKSLSL